MPNREEVKDKLLKGVLYGISNMPQALDQDVVNLAKAIRQTESGGNFTAKGKSGEYGAYQYTAPTWQKDASQFGVNVPLDKATPAQQNEVAYKKIKSLKDQGYNVGQIASIWNSGKPDAYQDPSYKGVNSSGASFDVPAYAKSVATAYHALKNGGTAVADPNNPSSTANMTPLQTPQQTQQPEGLGSQLLGRLNQASSAISRGTQGEINPFSAVLQTGGALAGGVGDVIGAGLELIPGVKQGEELLGKGIGSLLSTQTGKDIAQGYEKFSKEHPELSQDINAVGNIATLLPIGKGAALAKEGVAKVLGKSALKSVAEDIVPSLGAKAGGKIAAKGGLTKAPISGLIKPAVTKSGEKTAQTILDNVPEYTKLKTYTDKLNAVRDSAYRLADDLKQQVIASGQNKIYPFQELNARLKALKKPIIIRSDPALNRQYDLVREAALKIAKEEGGTISSLFDARKAFDDLVEKQFPTLYDRANAPMRNAITDIRREMNDFIAEQLPDVKFKDSLAQQSRLFDARDALAQRAFNEVGTDYLGRFAQRHPILKKAAQAAGLGVAGGLGFEGLKGLIQR